MKKSHLEEKYNNKESLEIQVKKRNNLKQIMHLAKIDIYSRSSNASARNRFKS